MTPQSQDLCFMSYRNYWGAGKGKSKQLRAHVRMKHGCAPPSDRPTQAPTTPNLGQIHFLKALYTNAASQKFWVTFECCIVLIIFISLKHWLVIYTGKKIHQTLQKWIIGKEEISIAEMSHSVSCHFNRWFLRSCASGLSSIIRSLYWPTFALPEQVNTPVLTPVGARALLSFSF